jgi:hypothetical protein
VTKQQERKINIVVFGGQAKKIAVLIFDIELENCRS